MVIVGGGECAGKAAMGLRRHGWTGPIELVGAEPTVPYERPPLTKAVLSGSLASAPRPSARAAFEAADVTLRLGQTVTALDAARHTVSIGGDELAYDALLLATGARPRPLRLPGDGGDRVVEVRTEAEALALRSRLVPGARVVVIGAGFIGLEVAAAAAGAGCVVDVVELAPRVLSRAVPPVMAQRVAARHEAAGVRLHLGVVIAEAVPSGVQGLGLVLSDGAVLTADVVVAGVGVEPAVELAAAAGLQVAPASEGGGIVVDEFLATSAAGVYAAGDCAAIRHPLFAGAPARFESWRLALEGGAHAAKSMLRQRESFHAVPWFWTDQFELTLQVAGLARDVVSEVVRDDASGLRWFGLDGAGRLVACGVVGAPRSVVRDLRVGERLIAQRAIPDPVALADPATPLRAVPASY